MALTPKQIRTVNPAANLAGIDLSNVGGFTSPSKVAESAIDTFEDFREDQEKEKIKQVLAEDGQGILEGDMEAFGRLASLPGGIEATKNIIELGKTRDENLLNNVTTTLKKNKVFNSMALKEQNLDRLRKTIRAEAQQRLALGDADGAEELLNISQLPTINEIQEELTADLAIADAGLNALASVSFKDRAKSQKTRTVLVKKPDGSVVMATGVFDPDTDSFKIAEAGIEGEILSVEGETQEEKAAREVKTAGEKKKAEQEAIVETAGDIEAEKGRAKRGQAAIDVAFETGEAMPILNRTLDLLDQVETGGITAELGLKTKQLLGVESADEGELSNLMGKAVLSQLRTLLGAAFTAKEKQDLEDLEAGFGKNVETNRRIIENAKRTTVRAIKRGIREARRAGQEEDALELEALLEARFEFEDETAAVTLPQGVTEEDIQETMRANDMTRDEVLEALGVTGG